MSHQLRFLSDRLFFDIETTVHPHAKDFVGLEPAVVGDLTVAELKNVLSQSDLPVSGTKDELINRTVSLKGSKHLMTALRSIEEQREAENDKDELMQDLISVITSFVARYYGQRRGKRKTERIIGELQRD